MKHVKNPLNKDP